MTSLPENAPARRAGKKLHQTTLRFSDELWKSLEDEAADTGVSVAQYVREAAQARLAYAAARRGDAQFEAALAEVVEGGSAPVTAGEARRHADDVIESSSALWAQSRQARAHSQELRSKLVYKRPAKR